MRDGKKVSQLFSEMLAIETTEAKDAGALGYMARALVQATMPHSETKEPYFIRENGNFTMTLMSSPKIGLPYGSIPRLIVSWLTTEAVRTKEREIVLGHSLSEFMRNLDITRSTGGKTGTLPRFKEQATRLFASTISCSYTNDDYKDGHGLIAGSNLQIAEDYKLWWTPKQPDQMSLFESTVLLSQKFFDEVTQNPIPIDQRALKALRKSPMALDQYCWLTYRMFCLRQPTLVPWGALQMQFGADYKRTIDFKISFKNNLKKVLVIYPEAKVIEKDHGLLLLPSPPHVAPRIKTHTLK